MPRRNEFELLDLLGLLEEYCSSEGADGDRVENSGLGDQVHLSKICILQQTYHPEERMLSIELAHADITKLEVDAIVNAANETLLGGGGVDGAIHLAAGPGLFAECLTLGGCRTGEAKMTRGHRLQAKHVIHTVGPVWSDGKRGEAELLRNCYVNAMQLAHQSHIRSIAFPSISTGAYRFPIGRAARIAITTICEVLKNMKTIERVIFVCFSQGDLEVYQKAFKELEVPYAQGPDLTR